MRRIATSLLLVLLLTSPASAYLSNALDVARLTQTSPVVCKVRVINVRQDGTFIDDRFRPILRTRRLVASVERIGQMKGSVPAKFEVSFPKSSLKVLYTNLSPAEYCLLFLKRENGQWQFEDLHNGKFPAAPEVMEMPHGASAAQRVIAELLAFEGQSAGKHRIETIAQLGLFHDPLVTARLRELYRDSDLVIRGTALAAGVRAGDAPPADQILSLYRFDASAFDEDASLRNYQTTGYSVSTLQGDLAWAIDQSVVWEDDGPARRIAGFDYRTCITEILATPAARKDAGLRRALASALRGLADSDSAPLLFGMLDDPSRDVRYLAATALVRIYHEGEFPSMDLFAANEKHYISFWKDKEKSVLTTTSR